MNISISTVLGVGLGLALVYYVLSLIVSSVTSQIAEWLNYRAKDLEKGLKELLDDPAILADFKNHALVKNLVPMKSKLFEDKDNKKGEDIPPETFALALLDVLAEGKEGDTVLKRVNKFLEAFSEDQKSSAIVALKGLIAAGGGDLAKTRKLMEGWFDDKMTQISALYKQHAKRIAYIVALVVTLVTGTDSIAIAEHLWKTPQTQHAIEEKVDAFLAQDDPNYDELRGELFKLEDLEIPVLWDYEWLFDGRLISDPRSVFPLKKVIGLFITFVATAQGSSFWYQVLKHIRGVTTGSKETTKETGGTKT